MIFLEHQMFTFFSGMITPVPSSPVSLQGQKSFYLLDPPTGWTSPV
jgi:hypothetical protein